MFRNYLKTALRSLRKNKSYSLLNILGLASGMLVFMLITRYVTYELSYDGYHEKKDRIFRVYKRDDGNVYQGTDQFAVVPAPLPTAMKAEFPEVEAAARVLRRQNALIEVGDEFFIESNLHGVDPDFFEIFSLEILKGDPNSPLTGRESVAISRTTAMKYFGTIDALGETLKYGEEWSGKQFFMQVTAVFEDMPENSHFTIQLAADFQGVMELNRDDSQSWNNSSYYAFGLLATGNSYESLQEKMPQIRAKYADDPIDEDGQESNYIIQPLADMHFTSNVNFDIAPSANKQNLLIYLGIAFMILIIAGVNYVNLATARVINKTKEIGIRKVIGAQKKSLLSQFLVESSVLVFTSLAIATFSLLLILPSFATFIDKPLAVDFATVQPWLVLLILGGSMTLLAGIYPAVLLAKFKPIASLKGKGTVSKGNAMFRNALVVFQFTISGILILGATVLSRQLSYIQTMDVGFDRDQIVVFSVRDQGLRDQIGAFKDEIKTIPGVVSVAASNSLPNNISSSTSARWPGMPEDGERVRIYVNTADYNYVDLYGLELVAGRNFDPNIAADKKGILINEAAAKAIGWDDPIGKEMVRTWYGDTGRVVGVLKDFHQHSVHLSIEPSQIFFNDEQSRISVKIEGDVDRTLKAIEAKYLSFNPKYPFDYNYFDDVFDRAYQTETRTAELANWFTALAIVIACLGLYGLAAHKVQHRIKEVGVRKVLGASVGRILALLSKDFALLLLVAFLIASPIAYYVMNGWLNDFAYHISINIFTFVIALVLMLLVAGLTVGYRTYRAAVRNPVEALREE
ncbi:ABC transporter permease [Roseivirga pacifica]